MTLPTLKDIGEVSGKRILVRVDWNVPLENGQVRDDFRIRQSLPTLNYLRERGARLVLMAHIEPEDSSLMSVYEHAKTLIPELSFNDDGDFVLLENLRNNPGEKKNDPEFAQELAAKGDIYVNEGFSVSHRAHASVVGVPKLLPSFVGLEFEKEVTELSKAFNPPHPFLFILGGSKFETKLPLVKKFQNIADEIHIAGANAKPAEEMGLRSEPKISFPVGDITALDADQANIDILGQKIQGAAFILWNGPLGKYEDGYTEGTKALAKLIAESGKDTIVGGGDTVTAIESLGIDDKFTFLSTAGGAMLDFLANETLPGIDALKR